MDQVYSVLSIKETQCDFRGAKENIRSCSHLIVHFLPPSVSWCVFFSCSGSFSNSRFQFFSLHQRSQVVYLGLPNQTREHWIVVHLADAQWAPQVHQPISRNNPRSCPSPRFCTCFCDWDSGLMLVWHVEYKQICANMWKIKQCIIFASAAQHGCTHLHLWQCLQNAFKLAQMKRTSGLNASGFGSAVLNKAGVNATLNSCKTEIMLFQYDISKCCTSLHSSDWSCAKVRGVDCYWESLVVSWKKWVPTTVLCTN